MKWRKVSLETTTEAVDLVSNMLDELGVEGIEIEDNIPLTEEEKQSMFIDILPELPPDEGSATVNFYLDMDKDVAPLLEQIKEGLDELSLFVEVGNKELIVSETEDIDWYNNWKEFFKPFRVDETIRIKPTWETLDDVKPEEIVVEIDPGTAFGTGAHETTKLCILNLKKYLKQGDTIFDVGCGSGILSIIGMLLGASYAAAVDIDEIAIPVVKENAETNKIPAFIRNAAVEKLEKTTGTIEVTAGNVLADEALCKWFGEHSYDMVVANILADVIIPLTDIAGRFMKPDGVFISSGIFHNKKEAVEEALHRNGFTVVDCLTMGDWVSLVAKKE